MLLTPESVDRDKGSIGRWGRISKRQSNVIPSRKHFGNGCGHDILSSAFILNSEVTSSKRPDSISPSLDGTIDQATIQPGGDLVQLHPGVVGMVTGSKVIAITQEWNDPL